MQPVPVEPFNCGLPLASKLVVESAAGSPAGATTRNGDAAGMSRLFTLVALIRDGDRLATLGRHRPDPAEPVDLVSRLDTVRILNQDGDAKSGVGQNNIVERQIVVTLRREDTLIVIREIRPAHRLAEHLI